MGIMESAGPVQSSLYYNSCLYITLKRTGKLGTVKRCRVEKKAEEKRGMGSVEVNNTESWSSTNYSIL